MDPNNSDMPPPAYGTVADGGEFIKGQPSAPYQQQPYGHTSAPYAQPVTPPPGHAVPRAVPVPKSVPARQEMVVDAPVMPSSGVFEKNFYPSATSICFMCPFPFFCLGCCLSSTTKLKFDDNTSTWEARKYPGLCLFPCCETSIKKNYSEIGNVYAEPMQGSRINRQQAYKVVILPSDGSDEFTLSDWLYQSQAHAEARVWHHFVFGRLDPNYERPNNFERPYGF